MTNKTRAKIAEWQKSIRNHDNRIANRDAHKGHHIEIEKKIKFIYGQMMNNEIDEQKIKIKIIEKIYGLTMERDTE